MSNDRTRLWKLALAPVVLGLLAAWMWMLPALRAAPQDDAAAGRAQAGEQEVVIKREALRLTDPKTYRTAMHLQSARSLVLTAPVDGYVRTLSVRPQQKMIQQAEILRMDDRRTELTLKRARALVQAALLDKKIAQSKGDVDQTALAEARLEAAQAEAELAQWDSDRLVLRAPFAGEIERVPVIEGQFVRAGEALATLIDPAKLIVEVPVDRGSATVGGTVDIKVEETPVKAKIEAVLPLPAQFDALRELVVSPASAIVSVDNAAGRFAAGQTVYSELIPLTAVTLVPTVAIANVSDGTRKVQVLRENVVRDLSVRILTKVGTDSVFVSGRFNEGDEVIVSSTRVLPDGTPLRALLAAAPAATGTARSPDGRGGAAQPPAGAGAKKSPSF